MGAQQNKAKDFQGKACNQKRRNKFVGQDKGEAKKAD